MKKITLDDLIANRELINTVSDEWFHAEIAKQPYDQTLRSLWAEKSNIESAFTSSSTLDLFSEIISGHIKMNRSNFYIKDVEIDYDLTMSSGRSNPVNEDLITKAAVGMGALATGSILSGGRSLSDNTDNLAEKPASNSDQLIESLASELEEKPEINEESEISSYAEVDPMLKMHENSEDKPQEDEEDDGIIIREITEEHGANELNKEEEGMEEGEELLILTDSFESKPKKTKKIKKSNVRWKSYSPEDYRIDKLDPFTTWINKIDGQGEVKPPKKGKKKNKFSKSFQQNSDLASEPLAELLADQGHISEAINMYELLSLKYPEKSSFFAAKIESLKVKQ